MLLVDTCPCSTAKGNLRRELTKCPGFNNTLLASSQVLGASESGPRPRYSEPHCDCKRSSSTMVAGDPWELPWTTKTILQKVHQPSHNRWVRPVWPAHFPGSCSSNPSLPATVGVLLYCYTDPQKNRSHFHMSETQARNSPGSTLPALRFPPPWALRWVLAAPPQSAPSQSPGHPAAWFQPTDDLRDLSGHHQLPTSRGPRLSVVLGGPLPKL